MTEELHHTSGDPTEPTPPVRKGSDSSGIMYARSASPAAHDQSPETIGPYRVHGRLGHGGMGEVFKASHQTELGKRVVAIKLVRRDKDTEEILLRFRAEQGVLSALSHPNIARFYEAAESPDGDPYFVMEFVEGQPIDEFCDANGLSIRRRLELFRKVCAAVHHAHSNGVVHRDLKPSNILVTPSGEPKLLDFGIAKLLNPNLARVAAVTDTSVRLMTPEYASPEQVRGHPVTTLSDVYSLGVLLYELLCGHRPYDIPSRLQHEIERIVCETLPLRPSKALTRIEDRHLPDGTRKRVTPETVSELRDAHPTSLRSLLHGDLDAVVMRAMAKQPDKDHRYASVEHLSNDLERFLKGLSTEARLRETRRPIGRIALAARKFAARHRVGVAAWSLALLVLVGSGVGMTLKWRQASIANMRAAALSRDAAESALAATEAQRREFMASRFEAVLWDQSKRHMNFALSPDERARLWEDIEQDFDELARQFGESDPVVRRARAKAQLQVGAALGGIREGSRGDFGAALTAYEAARTTLAALAAADPGDVALGLEFLDAEIRVGDTLRLMNRTAEAMERYRSAAEVAESIPFAPNDREGSRKRSTTLLSLAQVAHTIGEWSESRLLFEKTITGRRQVFAEFPTSVNARRDLAVALLNYGELLIDAGESIPAKSVIEESLSLRLAQLEEDPGHPSKRRDVPVARMVLGRLYTAQSQCPEAREQYALAAEPLRALAVEGPGDARNHLTLATCLLESVDPEISSGEVERAAIALASAKEALDVLSRVAPNHPSAPELRAGVCLADGRLARIRGDAAVAVEAIRTARDLYSALCAADPANALLRNRLAEVTDELNAEM